jgi:hypothetical protein
MFLNLTKLSFDNISPVGGNNQKPNTLETLAAPGAALGATALLGKGFHDVAKINNKFTAWDKALSQDRTAIDQLLAGSGESDETINKMRASRDKKYARKRISRLAPGEIREMSAADGQKFMDTYINGARDITQSKVLGLRAGDINLRKMQAAGVLGEIQRHLTHHIKNISPIQAVKDIPILRNNIRNNLNHHSINHYKLYSDPSTTLNDLRKHHIEETFHKAGPEHSEFLKNVNLPENEGFLNNLLRSYRNKFGPEAYNVAKKDILANTKGLKGAGTVLKMLGNNRATVLGTGRAYHQTVPAILNKILSKRLPILAGAGALTAATGYQAYNKLKNKQGEDNDLAVDLGASAGVGLGAGLVGYNVNRGLNPSKNIAVTYGMASPEYGSWDIGSGHKNPGEALFNLLQEAKANDPSLKKFNLSQIIRNQAGIVDPKQMKERYNVIADTGIGHFGEHWNARLNKGKEQHPDFFDHSNHRPYESRVGIMTDLFHSQNDNMSGSTFNGLRRGDHAFYYGNESEQLKQMQRRGINTVKTNKTFTPLVLNSAIESSRDTRPKEVVLDNLANERPELAQHIKELHGKKIVTISGSGRGDFVAERAIELSDALKKRGINNVKIIALTAGAGSNPEVRKYLEKWPNIIPIHGKLDNASFVGLQRIADVHMGSTGTSSLTESMMQSGGHNVVPPVWGAHTKDVPVNPNEPRGPWEQKTFYIENSLADRNKPEHWPDRGAFPPFPNTDEWNAGNREYAASMPGGLHLEDDPNKIIDFLQDEEALAKSKVDAFNRAKIVNKDIDKGRKAMPKAIFDIAKKNIRRQRIRGAAGALAGLGLTGGSIAAWLDHEKSKKNKR